MWSARPENVFHGLDKNKNRVDTPDSKYREGGFKVGEQNSGIPYKWGGFSAIEEFDEGIGEKASTLAICLRRAPLRHHPKRLAWIARAWSLVVGICLANIPRDRSATSVTP